MIDDQTIENLHDYLDGQLDDSARVAIEARLAGDSSLRAELESIRRVRAEVNALPRRLEPERDLWPAIASRLEDSGRRTIDFGRYRSQRRIPIAGRLIAAAAAVLLFYFGAPYLLAPKPADNSPGMNGADLALPADPEFQRVAQQYVEARDELMALLEERKGDLAPETFAVVEENLSVIASAVTEIETALAAQPENENFERMLYAAYRSEVNLLRQAVQLSGMPAASNDGEENEGDDDAV